MLYVIFQKGNNFKINNHYEEISTNQIITNFERSIKNLTSSIEQLLRTFDKKIALKKGSGGAANLFMYYFQKESKDYTKLVPTDIIRTGNIMSSTNQIIKSDKSFDTFIELNPYSKKGYNSGSLNKLPKFKKELNFVLSKVK